VGHIVHSVRPGRETSTHYFSCSGGTGTDSTKCATGHDTPNLCFCIRWDLRVILGIPVRPGREMLMLYFSCSGGTGINSTKGALGHITLNLCLCVQRDLRFL
jgi:hypothetical protein